MSKNNKPSNSTPTLYTLFRVYITYPILVIRTVHRSVKKNLKANTRRFDIQIPTVDLPVINKPPTLLEKNADIHLSPAIPMVNEPEKVAVISHTHHPSLRMSKHAEKAEMDVDAALRTLNEYRYFVFRDLILPSSYKELTLAQIDHVVVSHNGIFCIETKSHQGLIVGLSRGQSWKQYLGRQDYPLNSPFKQNIHHIQAIELLLKGHLKAPVHSYVAFPNAGKVLIDGAEEDMSPAGVVEKINRHTKLMYNDADVERIAKTLAHAGTFRESLRGRHIDEVRAYVERKLAGSLKLS